MRIHQLSGIVTMINISPLDSNMYIINGTSGSSGSAATPHMLIDTTSGHHTSSIKRAFDRINLDFSDISCIINTHSHIDHIGGNHLFNNAKIMMHKNAIDTLKEPTLKNTLARYYQSDLKDKRIHIPLVDGDTIRVKGTKLEILHTPGHSSDSISIYMPEERFLFTGDSIPVRIDKKISCYIKQRETEPETLKKLSALNISHILPGHGQPITDPEKIKELLKS